LFFPLRALNRPLLWATSVEILEGFLENCGEAPFVLDKSLSRSAVAVSSAKAVIEGRVFVESVSFPCAPSDALKLCAEAITATVFPQSEEYQFLRDSFSESVVVLPHETLSLLVQTSTEVTAQLPVRSEEGPVTSAGFFFRESLPSETVLYSVVQPDGHLLLEAALERGLTRVQLGADETRGRGICSLSLVRAQPLTQVSPPTDETAVGNSDQSSNEQHSEHHNSEEGAA
jgi:CRISPR/Cas system CMR subunit Cmr4 (Cas7 group RAMP superfamily)